MDSALYSCYTYVSKGRESACSSGTHSEREACGVDSVQFYPVELITHVRCPIVGCLHCMQFTHPVQTVGANLVAIEKTKA